MDVASSVFEAVFALLVCLDREPITHSRKECSARRLQ